MSSTNIRRLQAEFTPGCYLHYSDLAPGYIGPVETLEQAEQYVKLAEEAKLSTFVGCKPPTAEEIAPPFILDLAGAMREAQDILSKAKQPPPSTNTKMGKKSRLGTLLHKFNRSGFNGAPIISDSEMVELIQRLEELRDIFDDLDLGLINEPITNRIHSVRSAMENQGR